MTARAHVVKDVCFLFQEHKIAGTYPGNDSTSLRNSLGVKNQRLGAAGQAHRDLTSSYPNNEFLLLPSSVQGQHRPFPCCQTGHLKIMGS